MTINSEHETFYLQKWKGGNPLRKWEPYLLTFCERKKNIVQQQKKRKEEIIRNCGWKPVVIARDVIKYWSPHLCFFASADFYQLRRLIFRIIPIGLVINSVCRLFLLDIFIFMELLDDHCFIFLMLLLGETCFCSIQISPKIKKSQVVRKIFQYCEIQYFVRRSSEFWMTVVATSLFRTSISELSNSRLEHFQF